MVSQEKEVMTTLRSLGKVRILTREAYKQLYKREAADDGLVAEAWTSPTGQSLQVVKADQCWVATCSKRTAVKGFNPCDLV